MLAQGTLAELRERVESHGPLEDLFLTLTGGGRPPANARARASQGDMVPQGDPVP
jgi:hypothetical protein